MTPRHEALEIAITQNDESPWNSRGFHWSADQTCHRRNATVVANGKPKAEAHRAPSSLATLIGKLSGVNSEGS